MERRIDKQFDRRFGAEVELNTASGIVAKLFEEHGDIPNGARNVANIIHKTLNKKVEIHGWQNTTNNGHWIVKPDSSCGIEVCTPVLKGRSGLFSLLNVVNAFSKADLVADNRCSLHVHVNIADLNWDQLGKVIAYYVKCESVIFDSFPINRKNNRYCMFIGATNLFQVDSELDPEYLIEQISTCKYHSINAFRFWRGGGFCKGNSEKQTLEFRIAEGAACLDPVFVKNWIRFILYFVETTKNLPWPKEYEEGDPTTGLAWLDPKAVLNLLNFNQPGSSVIVEMRKWFINRIIQNGLNNERIGLWSDEGRSYARAELSEYINKHRLL